MQPNFEAGREVNLGKERVADNISSFIEDNGFWMFRVDEDVSEIRFQIWKDKSGNPMTYKDGAREFVERIKNENELIPNDASVELLQMAGGGITVSIKLDKSN